MHGYDKAELSSVKIKIGVMKLIRFGEKGREKPGVIYDGRRLDCSKEWKDWDRDFFRNGGLQALKRALEMKKTGFPEVSEKERWGAPVRRPGSIVCIGLNFSDHAKESGMEIPIEPILFMKASNTWSGPYDPVPIPPGSGKTDWEVELGLVIEKDVYRLESQEDGWQNIAGYLIIHDVSEREYQLERGGQWVKGKSCPGFTPAGPFLLTRDEGGDPASLVMELRVNGKTRQKGNTRTMVFHPGYLVWYVSQFMLLEAGDVITTGTPPGVGLAMSPPIYLQRGDEVELRIESLGEQKQKFI